MTFCVVGMQQPMFGSTLIAIPCNYILLFVNGLGCVLDTIIAVLSNDILCCMNAADCVWKYNYSETL